MAEEIRGATWDLDGAQLLGAQAANRLYYAGFNEAKVLTEMLATLYAESNWFLKAWHHNVLRNEDGTIKRDADGKLVVISTDLGFIQRNVVHSPTVHVSDDAAKSFTDTLFAKFPELANGKLSSQIAWNLYRDRGWTPWYANQNGAFEQHLGRSGLAVANFLAVEFGLVAGPRYSYYEIK